MEKANRITAKRVMTFGVEAIKPLFAMGQYLKSSSIEKALKDMIEVRVSQINGCAFCLDMHWKEAKAAGVTEQRLYGLNAWKESPYYSERERAALQWAEAVTACKIPDKTYAQVSEHFSEKEMIDLTMIVNTINTWNRLNIAFPDTEIGTYKVGQYD